MSASTELAVVPPKETALQVFQQPNGLDPWLKQIRDEIDAFVPDVSTRKGREAIASVAHRVARSKTALDGVGKELVAELKEIPKKIDAERKRMRDTLDAWRDEVRAPLNEWEAAEAARVTRHQEHIDWLRDMATVLGEEDSAGIQGQIDQVEATEIGDHLEEYEAEAHRTKAGTLATLREALAARVKYEAEQAELAELRRKQAEQEQKDREAELVRKAAEAIKAEAEMLAEAERNAAARRELDLKQAAEQSEQRRIAAEQQAEQAAKDAEAKAKAAATAERQRIAAEQAEIERQAKAREADRDHKKAICLAAQEAFVTCGIDEETARAVIIMIHQKKIPNITIQY